MRVTLARRGRTISYRLAPDADDRDEGRRGFADRSEPFLLVGDEYSVRLPESVRDVHPDAHALAIWWVLRPLLGSRLELPFAVSEALAGGLKADYGVTLPRTDARLKPRAAPRPGAPALLFSGGMDSVAAGALLPAATEHLFLDRVPRPRPGDEDALIDLARQRDACDAVRARGGRVHATADDHERLFAPYPMWHSDMTILTPLYLADSLGLGALDTGTVLDALYFGGYHAGAAKSWRFAPQADARGVRGPLALAGLSVAESIGGLSEVATTRVVARGPYRGKSFSCYYPSETWYCGRCDKCFKKLLLRHVADGEEVPADLFESFLSRPGLAAIFDRPYLDWHHVWYYLFQRMKCRHPFAGELARQARQGPDLSLLEKWYPGAAGRMEPSYAAEVRERIERAAGVMTAAEAAALERLEVPPLRAPSRAHRPAPAAAPGFPRETKALFKLLRAKLKPGAPLGGWTLDEVYLRGGDAAVWLSLKGPAGAAAAARLARAAADERPAARLGTLGVSFAAGTAPGREPLAALVRALAAAFEEAGREAAAGR